MDEKKLFKIVTLKLKGKAQDWYHQLDPPPDDSRILQALLHKYEVYGEDELKIKMDVMCSEPKQRV